MPQRYTPYRRFRRTRAAIIDAWLVLRESGPWLLAFIAAWASLGLLVWYLERRGAQPIPLPDALYLAFAQMLFEPQDFPRNPLLEVLFFLAPAIGLFLVARGALNAGLLIFDKRNRREAWQVALASTYRKHIIVCGIGKVGYRVVGQLLAAGHDVVSIERNYQSEFVESLLARQVPVIHGDARRIEILEAAGLKHAASVVCIVNDDLTNLDIALTARSVRPDIRIVLRVFNDALGAKLQAAFNINSVFSTSGIAAPTYAAAAINDSIEHALYVGGKFLSTQEVSVVAGGALDGRLIGEIEQQYDISVLYRRNERGEDLRPRDDYRLAGGDLIVIIGTIHSLEQITRLNAPAARPRDERQHTRR